MNRKEYLKEYRKRNINKIRLTNKLWMRKNRARLEYKRLLQDDLSDLKLIK